MPNDQCLKFATLSRRGGANPSYGGNDEFCIIQSGRPVFIFVIRYFGIDSPFVTRHSSLQ